MIDKKELDMHVETLDCVKDFLDEIKNLNHEMSLGPNGITELETLCKSANIETRDTDPALVGFYGGVYERDAVYKQQLSQTFKNYGRYLLEVCGFLDKLAQHYTCLNEKQEWFHEKPEIETLYQEALADKDFNWIGGTPEITDKKVA